MSKTVTFDVIARSTSSGFDKTNRDLDQQQKSLKLLSTAAVALGPALVPIAAGAAAAGAGLAALGATGVLAFEGIKKEMADGTPTGKAYSSTLTTLKGDLDTLERTAARGVLSGFEKGASSVHSLLPLVNEDTALLSNKLGDIVSHVGPGLVNLFTDANPLLLQFAGDLDKGAAKFEQWTASSDGAKKFVDYAQKELPQVEQTFLSLAKSGEHIVEGIAPLGGGSLTTLRLFSETVNHIPVGVLQALAPAIVALKVASTVSSGINNLGISLQKLSAGAAGGAAAGGIFGVAAAAATMTAEFARGRDRGHEFTDLLGHAASTSSDYETALIASGGALDSNVKSTVGLSLQQAGLAGEWQKAGVNLTALTAAVTGTDAQYKQFIATDGQLANPKAVGGLQKTRDQFQKGAADATALGQATQTASVFTTGLTGAQQSLYTSVMSSNTQLGYLNATLDKFSNFALDAKQQELKLKDSFSQATAQLKGNGSALNDNTVKGRANKEWLLSEIQSINQHVSAVGKQTGSVKQATAALASDEQGLRNAAKAAGLNTQQVNALIKQYGLTPKKLTTLIQADTSTALSKISGVQQALNDLQSYKVLHITEVTNKINAGSAGTNLAQRAAGGPVSGRTPYLVGEQGPEVFVPTGSGVIVPNNATSRGAAAAAGQVVNVNITVNAPRLLGGQGAGQMIVTEMERYLHKDVHLAITNALRTR